MRLSFLKDTMSHRFGRAARAGCVVAGLTALVVTTASAAGRRATPQEPSDDKGAAAFTAVCSKCHPAERIVATRRTKSQWEEVLDQMTKLGAPITDDNYDTLIDYLLRHYGKINVNRGESKDIALVASLSPKDADAIVKYRSEHGDFADFDALTKVPGIDVKALEEHRAALDF